MSPTVLLLAAGGSTRMGRAKQLLPYRGITLLRHAVNTALASRGGPVIVVIGSQGDAMRAELSGLPIRLVHNPDWEGGMGSSIRAGLRSAMDDPELPGVLIMLCDQPATTPQVLNGLIDEFARAGPGIVASEYAGIAGVPAIFDRSLFAELLNLEDSAGARRVIQRHASTLRTVAFPGGATDVDTPEEYDRLE